MIYKNYFSVSGKNLNSIQRTRDDFRLLDTVLLFRYTDSNIIKEDLPITMDTPDPSPEPERTNFVNMFLP